MGAAMAGILSPGTGSGVNVYLCEDQFGVVDLRGLRSLPGRHRVRV